MFNLYKVNRYRLIRKKSLYIAIIVWIAICLGISVLHKFEIQKIIDRGTNDGIINMEELDEMVSDADETNDIDDNNKKALINVIRNGEIAVDENGKCSIVNEYFTADDPYIIYVYGINFIYIFIASGFVLEFFKTGFIKTIGGQVSRRKFICSQMIALITPVLLLLIIGFPLFSAANGLLLGNYKYSDFTILNAARSVGINFLVINSSVLLIAMLSLLFKNSLIPTLIVYWVPVLVVLFNNKIQNILELFHIYDFELCKYLWGNGICNGLSDLPEHYLRVIIVAFCWGAFSWIMSCLLIKKRDLA